MYLGILYFIKFIVIRIMIVNIHNIFKLPKKGIIFPNVTNIKFNT